MKDHIPYDDEKMYDELWLWDPWDRCDIFSDEYTDKLVEIEAAQNDLNAIHD